jgi:hypothetical protein
MKEAKEDEAAIVKSRASTQPDNTNAAIERPGPLAEQSKVIGIGPSGPSAYYTDPISSQSLMNVKG